MNDYLLAERPSKRVFYGSTSGMFDAEEDEEQYFAFSKAAADSEFSIVGVTNSVAPSIMPNNNQGTLDGGEKGGSTVELTGSVNSHDSMSVDDVKIHTSINKGTGANIDVPNVGCKAEPSSKENTENTDGNKIGKSNSSKSPSSTSSSQPTPQPQTTTNNKKRTRATPEQLAILEDTFKTNTSPNSKVREALAEKVNMSERSIQIWFQNRRAKMKAMQKRAHLMINQDAIGHFMTCMPSYGPYPFRMPIHAQRIPLPRSYSASDLTPTINNVALAGMRPQPNSGLGITVPQVPQGFWPSGPLTAPITSLGGGDSSHLMNGFPFPANPIVNPQQQAQRFPISPNASPNSNAMNATQAIRLVSPTGGIPIKMNDQSTSISQPQQFTPPQEFVTPNFNNNQQISVIACDTLNIGTWRRILTTQAPTDLLCYYTIPQNVFTYHITNENTQFKMEFPLTDITSIEYRSIDDIYSQIAVEVKDAPHFYMESSQGGWSLCKDFTEDKQATRHMRHVMKGRAAAMKPQLIKLMQDCPPLAKVVTVLDVPVENQSLEGNNDADKQNEQDQQNPPRRSSFPSGSIADNLRFGDGRCTSTSDDKSNNLLKQIARTRRSASEPVSPTEEKNPSLVSSTMTPNTSLQVNTSSTFLDMYKAEANSSPEFCSSPMELNSTSSPSTPLYVFDNSPTIMDSSPLLNQDPFVSLPSHNLSNLTMDSSNLLSNDQIAAMVNFAPSMSGHGLPNVSNDDFASMFNMSSGSDTASDVSEFLTFNEFPNDAMGENKDGFSSTGSMVNLDVSSWVGGDVAYC